MYTSLHKLLVLFASGPLTVFVCTHVCVCVTESLLKPTGSWELICQWLEYLWDSIKSFSQHGTVETAICSILTAFANNYRHRSEDVPAHWVRGKPAPSPYYHVSVSPYDIVSKAALFYMEALFCFKIKSKTIYKGM